MFKFKYGNYNNNNNFQDMYVHTILYNKILTNVKEYL